MPKNARLGAIAELLAREGIVAHPSLFALGALVTGTVEPAAVQAALDTVNVELPHYRQIRNFTVLAENLTIESGLLTVMGKLRREAIHARFAKEISAMYAAALESKAAAGSQA